MRLLQIAGACQPDVAKVTCELTCRRRRAVGLNWRRFVPFRYKIEREIPLYFGIKSRIFSRPPRAGRLRR